jgi:hypothetical protein
MAGARPRGLVEPAISFQGKSQIRAIQREGSLIGGQIGLRGEGETLEIGGGLDVRRRYVSELPGIELIAP